MVKHQSTGGRRIDASRNRGTQGEHGGREFRARPLAHAPDPRRVGPPAARHRALGRHPHRAGDALVRYAPTPVARVEIRDRRTLYGLLVNPDVAFGDAVSSDRIRLHGDLVTFLQTVYRSTDDAIPRDSWKRRFKAWLNRPGRNTRARSQSQHPPPLRPRQRLLPALARRGDGVLVRVLPSTRTPPSRRAQRAKMDQVCRKLELRPGQRVVEAGSGWGSLAIHMARKYGAKVRAFNISHEQILYARERASAMGLEGQVEFVEDDYRTVEGEYDVFVSVGMFEHVGVDNYRTFGEVAARSLKPEGRGLIPVNRAQRPGPQRPLDRAAHLPRKLPPEPRGDEHRIRAPGVLRPRRREPAAALCPHLPRVARPFRASLGPGDGDVRR